MSDMFYDLYKSCYLETAASRWSRKKLRCLLEEMAKALGQDKADELELAVNSIWEEEGLRGFIEGFRFGMTVIAEGQ